MDILERLKLRTRETDEALLNDLIETAKNAILSRRFPYQEWADFQLESQYSDLQFRIALDLYNKQGAEGEKVHKENGIDRTFESSWISEQLLHEITPYVGTVR